jgi:DEAD/DEAH box helicase domain-containing protein
LSAVAARMNVPQAPSAWWRSNALDLLVAYLMDPDEATWHKQAEIIVLAAMGNVLQDVAARTSCELASQAVTHAYVAETSGSYLDIIASKRLQDVRQEAVLQEWHLGAGHSISLILTAANRQGQRLYEGVVRLEDNTTFREQDAFIDGWRAFWHWFHALQWLSDLRFVTASGVSQYRDDWLYLDALYPVAGIKVWTNPVHSSSNLDWIRLVREPLRTLALTIQQAGIPIPEVGFEYTRDGLVTWEAEIAWPDWKICLLYGQQQADREEVLAAGWRVWTLPWDATELEQMDDLRDQWSQLTRGGTEA